MIIKILIAVSKILAKIILGRMGEHLKNLTNRVQIDSSSEFSCASHINTLWIFVEPCAGFGPLLHLFFMDFEVAFHNVK